MKTNKAAAITQEQAMEVLRAAYMRRVEAFAEELREWFEAGKLRGLTDDDFEKGSSPVDTLEALCDARFANEASSWEEIHTILLVSPSAEEMYDPGRSARYSAGDAVARDVIRYARAQGWYVPAADERPIDERKAA